MLRLAIADGGDAATVRRPGNTADSRPFPPTPAPSRPGSPVLRPRPMGARVVAASPATPGIDTRSQAAAAVSAENHLASAHEFDPADPRWVLAVRTAAAIEGGRAAILPPESRARLLALGTRLGLRPFDSHLVLAIVQDAARSGREVVSEDARARIALVPRQPDLTRAEVAVGIGLRVATAALIAVAVVGVAIGWIRGD